MASDRLGYTFGPLERRGLLGGLETSQVIVLGLGALLAVTALDLSPSAGGAAAATLACLLAAGLALVPVGGRPVAGWTPVLTRYLLRRLTRGHELLSDAPSDGHRMSGSAERPRPRGPRPRRPADLRDVGIGSLPHGRGAIGIYREHGGRRLTAVLACRVAAFTLLDHDAQERRLARWGLVLAGAGGGAIHRLQWLERTTPAQGDELARWLHEERDPAVPPRGTAMVESYLELISASAQATREHEVLLAVQVDSRRVRDRGRDAVARALLESTEAVARGLEAAEVSVLGALGAAQLGEVLRTAFDPYARGELTALSTVDPGDGEGNDGELSAWPVGVRESWEHYACDGALHATFWVSAWPRVEVSPMFMDALLGHSGAVRSVAVSFEPLAPDRSTREVEAAITRDRADRELRARFGQSETARQRQAAAATARREAELAAGHGEVRFSGFVTVSGRDPDELRRACLEVQEQAARSRLELRRLYGQQAQAFSFTLPLARGLR